MMCARTDVHDPHVAYASGVSTKAYCEGRTCPAPPVAGEGSDPHGSPRPVSGDCPLITASEFRRPPQRRETDRMSLAEELATVAASRGAESWLITAITALCATPKEYQ